jgi:hypothetical protein
VADLTSDNHMNVRASAAAAHHRLTRRRLQAMLGVNALQTKGKIVPNWK